ncbi:MAG: 4-hydroxy-tetrahydrodipicolinate reductase, partial [Muribaculum sp.]|nr:4-hydroxy-tetrahydrodipicolinate reductase [Muribaculum sp.]
MKIALIGYGKMGHAIEHIAICRGHEIVCRIDAHNLKGFDSEAFASADVAIEFSTPATAVDNIIRAWSRGVKVVSGTTGWLNRRDEMIETCRKTGATLLWSSNFSLGVNLFFALNRYLASLMAGTTAYKPSLTETHHIHKLDHPSGTAITLAEGIIDRDPNVDGWSEDAVGSDRLIHVTALREGEVPGTHTVVWNSDVDEITITHRAKSRDGFALGAV